MPTPVQSVSNKAEQSRFNKTEQSQFNKAVAKPALSGGVVPAASHWHPSPSPSHWHDAASPVSRTAWRTAAAVSGPGAANPMIQALIPSLLGGPQDSHMVTFEFVIRETRAPSRLVSVCRRRQAPPADTARSCAGKQNYLDPTKRFAALGFRNVCRARCRPAAHTGARLSQARLRGASPRLRGASPRQQRSSSWNAGSIAASCLGQPRRATGRSGGRERDRDGGRASRSLFAFSFSLALAGLRLPRSPRPPLRSLNPIRYHPHPPLTPVPRSPPDPLRLLAR